MLYKKKDVKCILLIQLYKKLKRLERNIQNIYNDHTGVWRLFSFLLRSFSFFGDGALQFSQEYISLISTLKLFLFWLNTLYLQGKYIFSVTLLETNAKANIHFVN